MFLVAANHPFSDFADFTHHLILTTTNQTKPKTQKERESETFLHKSLSLFFFLPRNWTRSLYFGLRNMDNILMNNYGDKIENKCCFFSVFKTQWLWIPQEFLVLSERLLSCVPCIHKQLWLLSVLTFLAQSPLTTGRSLAFQNHLAEVL